MPGAEDRSGTLRPQTWATGVRAADAETCAVPAPTSVHQPGADADTCAVPAGVAVTHGLRDAALTLTDGQLLGTYRIVRLLGRGGMGQVYEADHITSGRRVALKLLRHELDDDDRARFLREGQMAAAISHPHTVYVYGTEELSGVPVISMELATNGTLHDVVQKQGPMEPAKAIEATLQIVSGLAAAARQGILHRDVKPHNCFLDANGGVKVGDFGLSIGSGGTDETQLTIAGTILGTPAYAAPEQLRGERVDVRADIYSVGATLFYLLTGRAPFEGGNVVQILSRVMHEAPPSVRTIRRGVPNGVARIVSKCLAKNASDRYQTYEDLEHALQRCTSGVAVAATLGRRTIAGLIDTFVVSILAAGVATFAFGAPFSDAYNHPTAVQTIVELLLGIAYFGGFEGLRGASPAKWLVGLRVVAADGLRAPLRAAVVRAAIFEAAWRGTSVISKIIFGAEDGAHSLVVFASLIVLFVLARRDNGWAGLHERFSGTRAIRRGRIQRRESVDVGGGMPASSGSILKNAASCQVGQFVIGAEHLWRSGATIVGYDPALARAVWIRPAEAGAPPIAADRRDLARSTRLRWIAAERTADIAWDAYEAVEGAPLLDPQLGPMPWDVVRTWLIALAEEIEAFASEERRPELRLDRVWVTSSGSVKLVDWAIDDRVESAELEPQVFLAEVASAALGRRRVNRESGNASPAPLHAWRFLERLGANRIPTLERVAGQLREFAAWPTKVSRSRRACHLAITAVVPAIVFGIAAYFAIQLLRLPVDQREHLLVMREVFTDAARGDGTIGRQAEVLIGERYERLSDAAAAELRVVGGSRLRSLAVRQATRDKAKIAEAEAAFADVIRRSNALARSSTWPVRYMATQTFDALVPLAWTAVVTAFVLRGGFFFAAVGMALALRRGGRASRWRAGWRTIIAWSPILVPQFALLALRRVGLPASEMVIGLLDIVAVCAFAAGTLWAVLYPTDSLQDRLAGTFVVRR